MDWGKCVRVKSIRVLMNNSKGTNFCSRTNLGHKNLLQNTGSMKSLRNRKPLILPKKVKMIMLTFTNVQK